VKSYPSSVSIFDPTAKELSELGVNFKFSTGEKILWVGTPSHFRVWLRIIGATCFFGLITLQWALIHYGPPALPRFGEVDLFDYLTQFLAKLVKALGTTRFIVEVILCSMFFTFIFLPGYAFARQILYVITNKEIKIAIGEHGKFGGAALFIGACGRFNDADDLNPKFPYIVPYSSINGIVISGGNIFFYISEIINRSIELTQVSGKNGSPAELKFMSRQHAISKYLIFYLFYPTLGVVDRLRSIKDVEGVGEIISTQTSEM
jgi:hypothetical protein